jgi:hypothetical protein
MLASLFALIIEGIVFMWVRLVMPRTQRWIGDSLPFETSRRKLRVTPMSTYATPTPSMAGLSGAAHAGALD